VSRNTKPRSQFSILAIPDESICTESNGKRLYPYFARSKSSPSVLTSVTKAAIEHVKKTWRVPPVHIDDADGCYREIWATQLETSVLVFRHETSIRANLGDPCERRTPSRFPENQMPESNKLLVLRDKLVSRRRAIVESLQSASIESSTGDDISRIQNEIDAVDKAIAEEKRAEFRL
jgi:hypothetical protein